MWRWLEQYFTFTRGEKNAIVLLVILSFAVLILPKVYFYFSPVKDVDNSPYEEEIRAFVKEYLEQKQLASSQSLRDSSTGDFNPYSNVELSERFKRNERKIEYFEFDPNKIGVSDWVYFGFSKKQAEAIENIKLNGYKFRKPEDLRGVYVVSEENYRLLLPYIRIDTCVFAQKQFPRRAYPEKPQKKFVLNINTADSSIFEQQRGIGPVLSRRIIQYRNRLGGFSSAEQIREVWGMPDSTYDSLKDRFVEDDDCICRVKINSADFETLRRHPYITYSMAKLIVAYRKQHGSFKETADILKIPVINDSIFRKLAPYLSVE